MAVPVAAKRTARGLALSILKSSGALRRIADSRWRQQRLLILCYHGISIDDEHQWRPALFMSPARFEERLERLRRGGYAVLGLEEGVDRLYDGTLPPRSVVLTFDDGTYDFYERAFPLLGKFGFPATVYQRSDYSGRRLPVFRVTASYLLWKGRGKRAELTLGAETVHVDTRTDAGRSRTQAEIIDFVHSSGRLSQEHKDQVLTSLSAVLELDYEGIKRKRILQIMAPEEIQRIAESGIDVQLHTHHHRSPRQEEGYRSELRQNRAVIEPLTVRSADHFCYPSGRYGELFLPWLRREGIRSATTCVPGLAARDHHPLLLPRFIDTMQKTPLEFESWLTGAGDLLTPRNGYKVGAVGL